MKLLRKEWVVNICWVGEWKGDWPLAVVENTEKKIAEAWGNLVGMVKVDGEYLLAGAPIFTCLYLACLVHTCTYMASLIHTCLYLALMSCSLPPYLLVPQIPTSKLKGWLSSSLSGQPKNTSWERFRPPMSLTQELLPGRDRPGVMLNAVSIWLEQCDLSHKIF